MGVPAIPPEPLDARTNADGQRISETSSPLVVPRADAKNVCASLVPIFGQPDSSILVESLPSNQFGPVHDRVERYSLLPFGYRNKQELLPVSNCGVIVADGPGCRPSFEQRVRDPDLNLFARCLNVYGGERVP